MSEIMMIPAHEFVLSLSMAAGILLVFGGLFGGASFRFVWQFFDLLSERIGRFLKWLSR